MQYFAQIVNDIVTEVIVVNDDVPNGEQFCHDLLGGVWVETFIDTVGKTYAGIGFTYSYETQDFIAPPPIEDDDEQ